MSARKPANRKQDRDCLLSDVGNLPGYDVDEFAVHVEVAIRKLVKLKTHADSRLQEEEFFENLAEQRRAALKDLNKWSSQTFEVMRELYPLVYKIRESQTMLEICDAERLAKGQ